MSVRRFTLAAAATAGLLGGLVVVPAGSAAATNLGTVEGNRTSGCAVDWSAASLHDQDQVLGERAEWVTPAGMPAEMEAHVAANWGRLFQDMQGTAVHPSNGGFLQEVSPVFGDPGRVEVQHYLTGGNTLNWRVFVGTDHAIDDARLTVSLPDVGGAYTVTDATTWGLRYAAVSGAPYTVAHSPERLEVSEVRLGAMPANSTTTVTFSATIDPSRHTVNDTFFAQAAITGTYRDGAGCEVDAPQVPVVPTPEPSTPAPEPSTPAPEPSTPAPEPSTPAPEPSTPAPSTPAPEPSTPAPSTPAPRPSTQAPTTSAPQPTPTTRPGTPVSRPTTPSTPAPTKTATPAPTTPSTPAPTKPAPTKPTPRPTLGKPAKPAMVTRTFQVDRYMPRTAAQARVVARLDDDGKLTYREDRALWGASRWQFVTVQVPANASDAEVIKAVNAKTSARIGDLTTTKKLARIAPGRHVVMAWELGEGATTSKAWGPKNTTAQVYLGRS